MSKDEPKRSGSGGWTPVLGLADPDDSHPATDWRERAGNAGQGTLAAGTVFDQPEPEELIELTVIVPARNEEKIACGSACDRW